MPVNWKDPEAFTRLLAAMVAAQDMKLNYRDIATYYGNGATYDSIEGRFRIIKKEAAALKAEIDNGERPVAPLRGDKSASTSTSFASNNASGSFASNGNGGGGGIGGVTPKKGKAAGEGKVLSGRVGKNTPTKGKGKKGVKEEEVDGGMMVGEVGEGVWEGGMGMGMGGGMMDVEGSGEGGYAVV